MKREELLKRMIIVSLVAALGIGIALSGGCVAPAPAPPEVAEEAPTYTWRMQNVGPAGDQEPFYKDWVELIPKLTGGRLAIDMYMSCELVPDDQMLPAVRAGTLEASYYMSVLNPSLTPLGPIEMLMPYAARNHGEINSIMEYRGLEELIREDYEEYGVHYVGGFPVNSQMAWVSTRPLRKYEDLKGLKISSFENYAIPLLKAGATLEYLPPADYYMAGKTGILDALGWGDARCAYDNSWYEVYPYYLDESVAGYVWIVIVVNNDVWDSLPEDLQAIFTASVDWLEHYQATKYYDGESKYRKYFKEVTKFSPEDRAKLVANAMEWWDEQAQKNERLAQAVEIFRDYNREVEETGWNRP